MCNLLKAVVCPFIFKSYSFSESRHSMDSLHKVLNFCQKEIVSSVKYFHSVSSSFAVWTFMKFESFFTQDMYFYFPFEVIWRSILMIKNIIIRLSSCHLKDSSKSIWKRVGRSPFNSRIYKTKDWNMKVVNVIQNVGLQSAKVYRSKTPTRVA